VLKLKATLLFAVFSIGCNAAPPAPTVSPTPEAAGTIVAFGDSLTAGLGLDESEAYPAQLQARLEHDGLNWKVVNAGSSGETSTDAAGRVDWVMRLHPNIVILETGANDGLRGLKPGITEKNLHTLIAAFKKQGVAVLLAGMETEQNFGNDYAKQFGAVYPKVAAEEKVPLLPFFLDGVAAHPSLNQSDRIHPTSQGYAIVVDHLAPRVEALIKKAPAP
jgi:acyl-CoA thioesterase-1